MEVEYCKDGERSNEVVDDPRDGEVKQQSVVKVQKSQVGQHSTADGSIEAEELMEAIEPPAGLHRPRSALLVMLGLEHPVYGSVLDLKFDLLLKEASVYIFEHFGTKVSIKHRSAYAGCCNVYGPRRNLEKNHLGGTLLDIEQLKEKGVVSAKGLYDFMIKQTEEGTKYSVRFPRLHGGCTANELKDQTSVLRYCVKEEADGDGRQKCSLCKRKPEKKPSTAMLDKVLAQMQGPEYREADERFERAMEWARAANQRDQEKRSLQGPKMSPSKPMPFGRQKENASSQQSDTMKTQYHHAN